MVFTAGKMKKSRITFFKSCITKYNFQHVWINYLKKDYLNFFFPFLAFGPQQESIMTLHTLPTHFLRGLNS